MFRTLDTFDTEFSADSVEWCPIDSFKDVFVCGTYQLMKDENLPSNVSSKRLGRIYLFQIVQNGRLIILQKLEVPAVLDMKWAHVTLQNKILLGVVNSLGHLQIYELKNDNEKITLELLVQKRVGDEVLALSLDWCTGRLMNEVSLKIVVSDSKGFVSLFELNENELNEINSWSAHGFEAWIAAFNYWNTNIIYSGGDDCKFQCIDTRIKTRVSNKVHGAGVTSIHSNAAREFLLSSGSYDEILRLWDTRNLKQPISNINLGGGIWRLKWDPFKRKYLLAACMYSGFRIVDCENTEIPSVIGEYNEHESIAYGCDWSYLNSEEISGQILEKETQYAFLITTCSFYDHVLKLSALYLKNN
ncbi:diphthine methyltransferase [Bombus pyrosoma]|uniref:diphthine methyltransferase n=1 Tax=Bombus pyrosoma TaxID=396416 RepID=UPI001CB8CE6C|nr:diphthine methyltransferase [Bombus pyrosoma]XP_043599067.1 diphthine methyltransferase [Bombus pyrosoma]XP_043599068.1 diphthine methyltransferase [Bombus pyrosoma]XP_043599070.1 diphthine methyltransferase [Bombus pyrosoma]XP_043599071.1 diphthine methyltransferase [Bombus pyrosoma]XP_043599072.1 diphthine methyltransferase [Bombus pyrosoma]